MNFIKKYKVLLLLVLLIVSLLIILFIKNDTRTLAIDKDEYFITKIGKMGEELKKSEEKNTTNNGSVENVALVNGQGISKQMFDNFVIASSYNELNQTKEELLNIMIDKTLLVQEAEKMGIEISNSKIEKDIDEIRMAYKEDKNISREIDAYIQGLDISFEEFLERNRKSLERDKKINELRKQILGNKNLVNGKWKDDPDWIAFKDKCRKNADIVIYREYLD